LGDLAMRLSVNLYGAPAVSLKEFQSYHQDTIVGVSLVVTAPSGQYIQSRLVNIGANRWSFKPEFGVSKRVRQWTFEGAAGVTFFTDNNDFFGNHTRQQDPLLSLQGHAIYNVNPRLWLALDGTFYTGGRTTTNGSLDNDLQRNSRWGGTVARTLTRKNSLKFYFSRELAARTGTEFTIYGIAWQYRWGAGL
jgi:hypothetical protein